MKSSPGRLRWYALRPLWYPAVGAFLLGMTGDIPGDWVIWVAGGSIAIQLAWDALLGTRYTKPLAGWTPLVQLPIAGLVGLLTWGIAPQLADWPMKTLLSWPQALVCLAAVVVSDYITTDLNRRLRVAVIGAVVGACVVVWTVLGGTL